MNKTSEIKKKLSRVFDDNLKTHQWKNIVDYIIMFFILISTLEVFLSTYTTIVEKYSEWLMIVDYVTIAFFTIEVSLRIWTCGEIDQKYKGWKGKLRYCFSFYGLIDILSTYPFYIHFFMPIPYNALKILRIARVLRLFRFMKSFHLLAEACSSKKKEMWISVQFLCVITFILSLLLYFVEHEAQPDVYSDGMKSVVWAFAQYIGDPGGFAEFSPITFWGRIIACIIGILGIAIFAVPAGLIGSAFIDVMDAHKQEEIDKKNIDHINNAFVRQRCRYTNFLYVPRYVSIMNIQASQELSSSEIIAAVRQSQTLRLRNTATTCPMTERPTDNLVVEHFVVNKFYGSMIDRHSKVTIVSTSSVSEAATGNFSYYLAKIGGFNYVSKEIEYCPEKPVTYYNIESHDQCHNLPLFLEDINTLSQKEGSWVIFILSASGNQEPVYPTDIHYVYGLAKGVEDYNDPKSTLRNPDTFEAMYQYLTQKIQDQFEIESDKQKYYSGSSSKNIARHIEGLPNAFTIRISWAITCWDLRYIDIAKTMADAFNQFFEPDVNKKYDADLKRKGFGYSENPNDL
ncbi:MAG: potassium channel family protein [Bacteroidales bacterium]|nr:potassium channel family protein [Bacteroidales bacterium]